MFALDMTHELAPLLTALNALLLVSSASVFGAAVMPALRQWMTRRPRLTLHRPALAGHGVR